MFSYLLRNYLCQRCPNKDRSQGGSFLRWPNFGSFVCVTCCNGQFEARLLFVDNSCLVMCVYLSSNLMARLGSLFVTHSITMAKCWLVRVYRCPNKDRSQGASLLRCPGFGSFVYYTTQIDDDHLRFVRRILTSQLRWPVSARSLA